MSGITQRCAYCGRPAIGAVVYGSQAEPYHLECTQSPKAQAQVNESYLSGYRDGYRDGQRDKPPKPDM